MTRYGKHTAGKAFTVKRPRKAGKLVHDDPVYALCPCCWRRTSGGYCSPEHEARHRVLAGT